MCYHRPWEKISTFVIFVTLISISCSTYKMIAPEPESLRKELKVGDAVKIMTKDGKESQFKIAQISKDSLFSVHQAIAFAQIAELKKINSLAGSDTMIRWRWVALFMVPVIVVAISLLN